MDFPTIFLIFLSFLIFLIFFIFLHFSVFLKENNEFSELFSILSFSITCRYDFQAMVEWHSIFDRLVLHCQTLHRLDLTSEQTDFFTPPYRPATSGSLIHGNFSFVHFFREREREFECFVLKNGQFCINRISSLVNIIEAPINGLNGIAFGGPYRDILFLVASMNVVNLNSSQRMQDTEGSALYMVTGVGAVATPSSRVLIH